MIQPEMIQTDNRKRFTVDSYLTSFASDCPKMITWWRSRADSTRQDRFSLWALAWTFTWSINNPNNYKLSIYYNVQEPLWIRRLACQDCAMAWVPLKKVWHQPRGGIFPPSYNWITLKSQIHTCLVTSQPPPGEGSRALRTTIFPMWSYLQKILV